MSQKETTEAVRMQNTAEPTTIYSPFTDILEREDSIQLRIDLPGMEASQIDVKYEDGTLSIAAVRKDVGPGDFLHQEFGATHFRRTFTIPDGYDPDKIEGSLEAGVLTLTLARAESFRPRRIEIH